jgi:uncharacterized Rossmann fold enzyme
MLNVVTINAQNYQGRGVEYTNILYDSVCRNLPEGFEGKFIVFTDNPQGYDKGIEVRPLPHPLDGWWNKLSLFKSGLFDNGDRVVYFDLSCVITGRLDALMNYVGEFATLRDFYYEDGLQSSVMAWEAGKYYYVWDQYVEAGYPVLAGGDQTWIENTVKANLLQDALPNFFISYKLHGKNIPAEASVVVCHGQPKPHQCDGWMELIWKVGGLARAELDTICNTEKEIILDNIRSSMQRDLNWFDFDYKTNKDFVCIVGGGPSLKDHLGKLRYRQSIGHKIFSTNNTHDYLIKNGIIPDAHFMVDAREENAEFVKNPVSTKYYIASMCHPKVFDNLAGKDVTVFHCNVDGAYQLLKDIKDKPVHLLGAGTTVGIRAMLVAELLGYRDISLYGMDSCVTDIHHSYPQPLNDNDRIITAVYGDREFKCAPWMIGQAQDFIDFVMRFTGRVSVAGDGLLAHIASMGFPENAADTRAREILSRLNDCAYGAEIGVFAADLSERLLARDDMNLIMVDSWAVGNAEYSDSGDFHASLTQEQQDMYCDMATNRTEFAKERREVIRKPSTEAANAINDASLDFVFIDADHSYNGCKNDIYAWYPKVKDGGLFSGHDYENTDFPKFGVKQAVDEFVKTNNLALELGDNFTWFIRKPINHLGDR